MQHKNPAESFLEGMQAVMETQRKNFQALAEANQRAMQGWQTLARRQSEMVSRFVQDNGASQMQPAEARKNYDMSLANAQELVEIMRKTVMDTADVVNRRIVASVGEIKASARDAD